MKRLIGSLTLVLMGCAPALTAPPRYVVQPGDTLYSLARRFGTTVAALQAANHLEGTTIYAGQVLVIPSSDTPAPPARFVQEGYASYYGPKFHGRKTASGEVFDMYAYTAAHRTLPFGTLVRVTRLDTGKSVVVRINDRGPWKDGRIIDLSYRAAQDLEMIGPGVVWVRLEVIEEASTE